VSAYRYRCLGMSGACRGLCESSLVVLNFFDLVGLYGLDGLEGSCTWIKCWVKCQDIVVRSDEVYHPRWSPSSF
jgi:hypothetical protein